MLSVDASAPFKGLFPWSWLHIFTGSALHLKSCTSGLLALLPPPLGVYAGGGISTSPPPPPSVVPLG